MSLPQIVLPCPNEDNPPAEAPGKVENTELVIRVAVQEDWVLSDSGSLTLSTAAFTKNDLQGRKGASVSLIREMTSPAEVLRRARALTKEPRWVEDPILGRAVTDAIRRIVDDDGRREFCVNADIVDDDLGKLVTHASLLRSCPIPNSDERALWSAIRLLVAQTFNDVRHCSGRAFKS